VLGYERPSNLAMNLAAANAAAGYRRRSAAVTNTALASFAGEPLMREEIRCQTMNLG
jgi:hypothetical protein